MGSWYQPDPAAPPPPDQVPEEEASIPSPPGIYPSLAFDTGVSRRGRRSPFMLNLCQLTGLLVYGEYNLAPAAYGNICAAAFFLIGLLVVDSVAWSMLANMFLTGNLYQTLIRTVAAGVLGVLAATLVMKYEATFLTADFHQNSRYRWVAIGVRLMTILFIAFATSLPLDLFLLDDQINRRIHQEQVLQQLPDLVRNHAAALSRPGGELGTAIINNGSLNELTAYNKAVADRDALDAQLKVTRDGRANQQRHVAGLESQLARVDPQDRAEKVRIGALLSPARGTLTQLQNKERDEQSRLNTARDLAGENQRILRQKQGDLRIGILRISEQEARRYESWIHQIWDAKPLTLISEAAPPKGEQPWIYDGLPLEGHVGVGERLIVLSDVLNAEPPRRPKMSQLDRDALDKMGLSDFVKSDDAEAMRRQQSQASTLRRLVLLCSIVFTILPILIIAAKLLFSEDTALYYSRDYQRRMGNPEIPDDPADLRSAR